MSTVYRLEAALDLAYKKGDLCPFLSPFCQFSEKLFACIAPNCPLFTARWMLDACVNLDAFRLARRYFGVERQLAAEASAERGFKRNVNAIATDFAVTSGPLLIKGMPCRPNLNSIGVLGPVKLTDGLPAALACATINAQNDWSVANGMAAIAVTTACLAAPGF